MDRVSVLGILKPSSIYFAQTWRAFTRQTFRTEFWGTFKVLRTLPVFLFGLTILVAALSVSSQEAATAKTSASPANSQCAAKSVNIAVDGYGVVAVEAVSNGQGGKAIDDGYGLGQTGNGKIAVDSLSGLCR